MDCTDITGEPKQLKVKYGTHARIRSFMHKNELESMDAAINWALDAAEK